MSRKDITGNWTRDDRNAINNNFTELYREYVGAGLDAAEAKEKAIQAVADSLYAKETAETTRDELTRIIREQTSGGDIVPEVVQARGNESTLGNRLNSISQDLAQTTEDLNKRGVHISEFGYVGNDPLNDTEAIEEALNSEIHILFEGGLRYRTAREIIVTKDVSFSSSNDTPFEIVPDGDFSAFDFTGNKKYETTLSADVFMNDNKITLQDASDIEEGDLIVLQSTMLWYYDNRDSLYKGEVHEVLRVVGNDVYLSLPTWDSYKLANEMVVVEVYKPIRVLANGLKVVYDTPQNVAGIKLSYNKNSSLINVGVKGARNVGLMPRFSYNTIIKSPDVKESNASTTGYGIQDNGSLLTWIDEGNFNGNRRAVDFSGSIPSRLGTVSRSIAVGDLDLFSSSSGFGTHGTAEHIKFIDNKVYNVANGFFLRGGEIEVKGNELYGRMNYGIVHPDGTNHFIEDNIYKSNMVGKDITGNSQGLLTPMISFAQLTTQNSNGYFHYKNNKAEGIRSSFIQVGNVREFKNLICENNDVLLRSQSTSQPVNLIRHGYTEKTTLSNSTILNNTVTVEKGRYEKLEESVIVDYGTCYFDFIKRDPSRNYLELWGSGGGISDAVIDIEIARFPSETKVVGTVTFNITSNNSLVRLVGLPRKLSNQTPAWLYVDGDSNRKAIMKMIATDQSGLYIGFDDTRHSSPFPTGTNYNIPIDISYKSG